MPSSQLVELFARRVGVIDEVRLAFGPGFSVITGETGAGKTLLIGALALCLGRDSVTSRYAVGPDTLTSALFVRETEEILVSRDVTSSGRRSEFERCGRALHHIGHADTTDGPARRAGGAGYGDQLF